MINQEKWQELVMGHRLGKKTGAGYGGSPVEVAGSGNCGRPG